MTTSMPSDIMHDLLEEVFPLTMKQVLIEACTQNHLSITELNEELQRCVEQNDKANKPVMISAQVLKNKGIVETAAQKYCLFRLLPLRMGHRVPAGSRYWHVFLICKEIADIVLANKVRKDELPYLELLVHTFLSEMTEVFGTLLTPKCH